MSRFLRRLQNKLCLSPRLFPRASPRRARREGTMPPMPLTERAAMALRVAGSRVSSVLSGVGRDQRPGVAARSAATIPARTSGGRFAHAATRRARSVSGGALPPPAFGRDVGGTGPPVGPPARPRPAPRLAPGAACAAPGAARPSESAYSSGDSASARGFDSPRLHWRSLRLRACAVAHASSNFAVKWRSTSGASTIRSGRSWSRREKTSTHASAT